MPSHTDDRRSDDIVVHDFERFHALTYSAAVRGARRWTGGNDHDTKDLVQDAYLRMMTDWQRHAGRCLRESRAYLLATVKNKAIDLYRSSVRLNEFTAVYDVCPRGPDVDALVDRLSLHRAVRELLDEQPPVRRLVVILYFVHDYTYAEISRALHIAESTARTHVERTRAALKPHQHRLDEILRGDELS
ncbi:hypothetical protein Val02_61610 [Virgisporangium aliadipatigenens]|uniref:Sigma-70 family RNA polymerase sigma factor n=1 Tax=Virgisporangium aliadipatigenens TaxID=741659 RepID=A0A8J3YSR9_9ACTN|nr:RNA polymerase sigma factor [Virgisporangium aliadipatigenens]GIJ49275.1 hypothetical protein Val02_61610 [Virgisporangium aliadipatigenens]